jgi:transcriptional regulator with XRE-family HTH domain
MKSEALRRSPGSPKGQKKPMKRTLDPEFRKRLHAAMKAHMGIEVPELAAKVGCTRAVLHKYLNGNSKTIEALLLFELADKLNVSTHWLLLGQGPMGKATRLSPDQNRVLELYSLLNEKNREAWLQQGEVLHRLQPERPSTPSDPYAHTSAKIKRHETERK